MEKFGNEELAKMSAERAARRVELEVRENRDDGRMSQEAAAKRVGELRGIQDRLRGLEANEQNAQEVAEVEERLTEIETRINTRLILDEIPLPTGEEGDEHPKADKIRAHLTTQKEWLNDEIAKGGPREDFYKLALATREQAEGLAKEKAEYNQIVDENDAMALEMMRIATKGYMRPFGGERSMRDVQIENWQRSALQEGKWEDAKRMKQLIEGLRSVPREVTDPRGEKVTRNEVPVSDRFRDELSILLNKFDMIPMNEGTRIAPPDKGQFREEEKRIADRGQELVAAYPGK